MPSLLPYKINKGQILNIVSNPDTYRRGERYYTEGKVLEIKARKLKEAIAVEACIKGNYKTYTSTVEFHAGGQFKDYSCTCQAHSIWQGGCKHVAALLFYLLEEGKDKCSITQEDICRRINDSFAKQAASEMEKYLEPSTEELISLAPVLNVDERKNCVLTFNVGAKRKYLIKNISQFLNAIKQEEIVSYGKELSFAHKYSAFEPKSQGLIDFMLKDYTGSQKLLDQMQSYSWGYRHNNGKLARQLALFYDRLDQFLELWDGREIEADIYDMEEKSLLIELDKPPYTLSIRSEGEKVILGGLHSHCVLIKGADHHYIIMPGSLHRGKPEDVALMTGLLDEFQLLSRPELVFEGDRKAAFINFVLPKLKALGLLDENTALPESVVLPEPISLFYLDMEEGDIALKLSFKYEDGDINPLEASFKADCPLRNLSFERKCLKTVNSLGFRPEAKRNVFMLSDEDTIFDFMMKGIEDLGNEGEVYVAEGFSRKAARKTSTKFGVTLNGSLLEMRIDTEGYTLTELLEALEAYSKRKRYHRLKNGRFLNLEDEALQSAAEMIISLDIPKKELQKGKISLPKYRAVYLDSILKKHGYEKDKELQELTGVFDNMGHGEFIIPDSIESKLRSYQRIGFNWLSSLTRYGFGGILADDMGLGKTIQVIALLLAQDKELPSLVVCPSSVLYNWQREIKRFAPELEAMVVAGQPSKRQELLLGDRAQVYISTYDTMKRDIEFYEDMEFQFVIADEAQNIKNPLTQSAQAIKSLKSRANFALTGTPIENSLIELWSIFDFVMPGYLYSNHKFIRLYENPIIKENDNGRAEQLKRQIAPFVLRRTKSDVLKELPEKVESNLFAEMEPEQKKLYTAHLMSARGEMDELLHSGAAEKNRFRILAELTRLRQICCHPALFLENYSGGSGKLKLAMETIISTIENGHRILLFSGFTSMLSILKEKLEDKDIAYYYLDGATDSKSRMQMTLEFNAGARDIFLISLKAGGAGLNLTGADIVIHYDPWWNPAVMEQASDRAHRFGQKNVVQVFNLVTKDSIEEKILDLQEKKKDLIDKVIQEGASFITRMSEDEIRGLFQE